MGENENTSTTTASNGQTAATTATTPTTSTETPKTLTATTKDDKTVEIDGVTYVVQSHVDSLVGTARTEGKATGKTEAQKEAERIANEAAAAERVAQGQFKELYEAEKAAREASEAREREALDKATKAELEGVRREVAADHKIPAALAHMIAGSTKEEMVEQAKIIAANIGPAPAVNTQTGAGAPGSGGGTSTASTTDSSTPGDNTPARKQDPEADKNRAKFAFEKPGQVRW